MRCVHCKSEIADIGDCCSKCKELLRERDPEKRREAMKVESRLWCRIPHE